MEYLCGVLRFALRGYPGHVAVNYDDHVGGFDGWLDAKAKA